MGQSPSDHPNTNNQELFEKLSFILAEQNPHYGELLIYRLTQKPYDYYLRYRETYQNNPNTEAYLQRTQRFYSSLQGHRNIVKVDITRLDKATNLCSSSIIFDCYARYHNYTLQKAIECKRHNNKMFRDNDLLYIFLSLADVGQKLSQGINKIYMGPFKASRIFLSTEGFVKIYPFRINQLTNLSQLSLAETSHESEIDVLSNRDAEKNENYRIGINDLQDLAFLMTQLCLLETRQDLEALTRQHTKFRLEKGLAGRISLGLRQIIIRLLDGEEFDWDTLKSDLELIRANEGIRPAYCIRLEEDISMRESEIMLRQNQEMLQQKMSRQSMLSSVRKNLVPARIEAMSRKSQHP